MSYWPPCWCLGSPVNSLQLTSRAKASLVVLCFCLVLCSAVHLATKCIYHQLPAHIVSCQIHTPTHTLTNTLTHNSMLYRGNSSHFATACLGVVCVCVWERKLSHWFFHRPCVCVTSSPHLPWPHSSAASQPADSAGSGGGGGENKKHILFQRLAA